MHCNDVMLLTLVAFADWYEYAQKTLQEYQMSDVRYEDEQRKKEKAGILEELKDELADLENNVRKYEADGVASLLIDFVIFYSVVLLSTFYIVTNSMFHYHSFSPPNRRPTNNEQDNIRSPWPNSIAQRKPHQP